MYVFVRDGELIDQSGCVFGSEGFKRVLRMMMRGLRLCRESMYV